MSLGQLEILDIGVQEAAGSSESSGLGSRWLGPDKDLGKRVQAGLVLRLWRSQGPRCQELRMRV